MHYQGNELRNMHIHIPVEAIFKNNVVMRDLARSKEGKKKEQR